MVIGCRTLLAVLFAALAVPGWGADLTRDQVVAALSRATPTAPADFSGRSLEKVDLSGLDLSRANFAGADLYAAKLEDSNLTGADLTGANLGLAWVIRANFTDADLSGAKVQGLVVASGMQTNPAEAPVFLRTRFVGARVIARFGGFDLRGADFTDARLAVDMRNQSMGIMRADFSSARLEGANFTRADLGRAWFRFARLQGARFTGASLLHVDFSGADLTGADLTGADATGADFGQAILTGAIGLDTVKGLDPAVPRR
jgi:uncharacterized protein YjbI with pentapeptide repeats